MHMKKFTFLVMSILLITMGSFAQNLIENPGFESWTSGQPDVWTTSGDAITLSQNTSEVQEGSSSCQVVFTSDANQNLMSNSFAVNAGDPIAVSFYVYDNDLAGRARLSILYDAGGNYYGNEYSEDMDSWQLLSYEGEVPDDATTATFQVRFYDVAANWDGDALILVDNSSFIIDDAVKPEPSNYPTDFAAAVNGVNANVTWTDATGDQLPQRYLVLASANDDIMAPVDGTPVDDDTDMSDGSAALNIAYGEESAIFGGLTAAESYYFAIYPYTNSADIIDYKTDGAAPSAELTMPDVSIINSVDFEDDTFGDWIPHNIVGNETWEVVSYGNPGNCAKMSGFNEQAYDNEDWLVSPEFNFDDYSEIIFSFDNAMNYEGPAMQFFISSNYDGDVIDATWLELEFNASPGGNWDYVSSGDIDLDLYTGMVNLAFKFTSTTSGSATWELDNLLLTGVMSNAVEELGNSQFKIYPNPGYGLYQFANVNAEKLNVTVYNVLGQVVQQYHSADRMVTLDISSEMEGVYLVQIEGKNSKQTISVIKR